MAITRQSVLQFIAKNEPVSTYPLIEMGEYGILLEMRDEGLLTITGGGQNGLPELRLTEKRPRRTRQDFKLDAM